MADKNIRRRKKKVSKDGAQVDGSRPLNNQPKSKKTTVQPITKSGRPKFGGFNLRTAQTALGGADVDISGNLPFFSPQLSTDYFELPRSNQERREWYRHFYDQDEIVARAIDLHCDLPLSKVTLGKPKCKDREKADYIHRFYLRLLDRLKFFQRLEEIAHEYWLFGNVFIFAEDDASGIDDHIYPTPEYAEIDNSEEDEDDNINDFFENEIDEELSEEFEEIEDQINEFIDEEIEDSDLPPEQQKVKEKVKERYKKWGFKNPDYKGWRRLIVLPPDQVVLESFDFTDQVQISLVPSESMKRLLQSEMQQDEKAINILNEIPEEILEKLTNGDLLPLDVDPYSGSHCYHMAKRKSQYEDYGSSILQRCLRTLLFRDKLRQSQTMIADRALTPKHLVWADQLSDFQVDELREHVDLALVDPDYAIVTNYQVTWDKVTNSDRLLDLSGEYQEAESRLLMGLGITKELLTGEGSYGGNRITLEIMNTQYLLFREKIQTWVEEYLFKPIAVKKGFYEIDPIDGEINPIVPKLKFTRLSVRDNADTYEQLFALYQKGSLPVDYILELFNIDADDTREQLEKDLMTVNDNRFNDLISAVYQTAGQSVVEQSNVTDLLIDNLRLEKVELPSEMEGGGEFARFAKEASVNDKDKKSTLSDFEEFLQFKKFLKLKQDPEFQKMMKWAKSQEKPSE